MTLSRMAGKGLNTKGAKYIKWKRGLDFKGFSLRDLCV
jgi:hypothetical protein